MRFPRMQDLAGKLRRNFEHTIKKLIDIASPRSLLTREFDQAKHFFNHGENIRGLIQLAVVFLSIPYSWVSLPFSLVEDLAEMGILTNTLYRLLNTFGQRQGNLTLTGYKISAFANMIFMAPLRILSLPWKVIEDICDMVQTLTNERIMKNTLDNIREIARLDPIKLYSELNKSIILGFPKFLKSMVAEILRLPVAICKDIPSLIYEVVSLPWTIAAGIKSVWDRDTVVGNKQEGIREPSELDHELVIEDDEELTFQHDNCTGSFDPGFLPFASNSRGHQLTLAELLKRDTGVLTPEEMERELARVAKLDYV